MRAVVQRVVSASVTVDGKVISEIGRGLCVLVGISRDDQPSDIDYLSRKIVDLRIFEGEDGKRWHKSVKDLGLEVLCVSQFTLHAYLKGNRPDFHLSMAPDKAPAFYAQFMEALRSNYVPEKIQDGLFGAYMQVNIANDGPVTINLDSRKEPS